MIMQASNDVTLRETLLSNEKVFIIFHSKRCGICKIFMKRMQKMETEGQLEGVVVTTVDIEESPEAAKAFSVQGTPHFVTFSQQEVVESLATSFFTRVDHMLEHLREAVNI
jgi:thiol-disulfide isomerase/thioredoxin